MAKQDTIPETTATEATSNGKQANDWSLLVPEDAPAPIVRKRKTSVLDGSPFPALVAQAQTYVDENGKPKAISLYPLAKDADRTARLLRMAATEAKTPVSVRVYESDRTTEDGTPKAEVRFAKLVKKSAS